MPSISLCYTINVMAKKKRAFSWIRVFDVSARVLAVFCTAVYLFFLMGEVITELADKGSIDLGMWSLRDLIMLIFGPVTFIIATLFMFFKRNIAGSMLLSGVCILLAVSPWMNVLSWGFFIAYLLPMVIIGIELLAVKPVDDGLSKK